MSQKPIFVATHPRACSTAFERVFMTRRDILKTVHEPFGDAWYYGPERLNDRYENDVKARNASGFSNATYRDIFESLELDNPEGKRLFIKDMAQYWMPLVGKPPQIAPSLASYKRGVGTNGNSIQYGATVANGHPTEIQNATIVPEELLQKFHFAFLIRHPRSSIPSYYRCTVPPLDAKTGFYNFRPEEAGYAELRRFFDYARETGLIGPKIAGKGRATANGVSNGETNGTVNGHSNGTNGTACGGNVEICLVDADDLLDAPYAVIEAFCNSVGMPYTPDMLHWGADEHQHYAAEAFAKWPGFHEDALDSSELKPRTHKKAPKTDEQLLKEWTEKFGEEGAQMIMRTVKENEPHYEYLKQFALRV